MRTEPTSKLWQKDTRPWGSPEMNSVEPPPVSITTRGPEASRPKSAQAEVTHSRASPSPERMSTVTPARCWAAERNSAPFSASRAALVADTAMASAPRLRASEAKAESTWRVSSMPSGERRRLFSTPRPRRVISARSRTAWKRPSG